MFSLQQQLYSIWKAHMEKNVVAGPQQHKKQQNVQYPPNKMQLAQKVISLRQSIYQIFIHPQKLQSAHSKSLQLRLADAFAADQGVETVVQYLKDLKGEGANRLGSGISSSLQKRGQLKQQIVAYFLQPILMRGASQVQKIWRFRQLYFQGERLLKKVRQWQFEQSSQQKERLSLAILMNRVVCCLQVESYQKALDTLDQLKEINLNIDSTFLNQVQFIKKSILFRMGCRITVQPPKLEIGHKKIIQTKLAEKIRRDKELCLRIVTFDKQTLCSFIYGLRNKQIPISLPNLYNLALVCKRYQNFECCQAILKKIISTPETKLQSRLKLKSLALLSEMEQQRGNLWGSLQALKQIKLSDEIDINQWQFRKTRLYRKIKIEKASDTCSIVDCRSAIKMNLLCGLQGQLFKLKDSKQKTQIISKKNVSKMYNIITRKKTIKRIVVPAFSETKTLAETKNFTESKLLVETKPLIEVKGVECQLKTTLMGKCCSLKVNQESMQSTQLHTKQDLLPQPKEEELIPISLVSTRQQSINSNRQIIRTQTIQSELVQDLPDERQQKQIQASYQKQLELNKQKQGVGNQQKQVQGDKKKSMKKGVKFSPALDQQQTVAQIIYKGEERIVALFMNQSYEQIVPAIKSYLQQLNAQQHTIQIQKCILKCATWYKMLAKQNQAIALLKTARIDTKDKALDLQLKKNRLRLLGQIYQQTKDSKSALGVYLQLAKMGEVEYYSKLGEIELLRQHYGDAVKYFQFYHQMKADLESKSKLAHACSKMGIYKKKAVDLLNQMLFENKNLMIFRQFEVEESYHAQNAVLLLATIYLNDLPGTDKAKNICQKFLQTNYSAYPVYYLLGVINEQEGNKQQAFQKYMTALKLKPNHLPSLIRVVNDIGIRNSNNFEITNILRKAFVQNNRNWQLLLLLVQSITLVKQQQTKLRVDQLVRCARILQKAEVKERDLDLEIEMVWTWAFELAEERRRREQVFEDQHENQINMKLGEINMAKGNLKASEFYLKKVLAKLELRRKRTERRRGIIKCELQAMQRLSYIRSRQNESLPAKVAKKEVSNASKHCNMEKRADSDINVHVFSPRLQQLDINKL